MMKEFTKSKKTVAVQFTGSNYFECMRFMSLQKTLSHDPDKETQAPVVNTLQGPVTMTVGQYITEDGQGNFSVHDQKDFEAEHSRF